MAEHLAALVSRGYAPDDTRFSTGRLDRAVIALTSPTGVPVVAKLFWPDGAELAYANMQELWRSSFGEGREPPGLPRPIEYLPDLRVLIMERLEGRPWIELGGRDADTLRQAVHLMAALHVSDARPSTRRDAPGIVRSARRRVALVGELVPSLVGHVRDMVDALEAAQVPDRELVPSHGEFSARNVLVGEGRLALIDWDRFQWADSAHDVANLGAWAWVSTLQEGGRPDWSLLEQAVAIYDELRPEAMVGARLDFHIAAGLARIAAGLALLWSPHAHLVPQLAAETLRRLR